MVCNSELHVKAKIVEKCGTRDYWEKWAQDIAKVAKQIVEKISSTVSDKDSKEAKLFQNF